MNHKLGIIVPYRNRYSQLEKFLEKTKYYLENRDYNYTIIIVEQDDASSFNRGMLCNIGFKEAIKQKCDYVIFHDVDMLPKVVDYSYADIPLHLATQNLPFDSYFGGVTLFPVKVFKEINGFSNYYWGWGVEDADLIYRCKKNNIKIRTIEQTTKDKYSSNLRLNGDNSRITLNNIIDIKKSFSIGIKVILEEYKLNHKKTSDKFTLINIPGLDFSLHYSSFKRFVFEFFNIRKNYRQVYSEVVDNLENYIFITFDKESRLVSLYVDGEKVDSHKLDMVFFNYNRKKEMYLGNTKNLKDGFKGCISNFSIFNKSLEEKEIKSIFNNQNKGITTAFEDYKSNNYLQLYFDTKFTKDYKLVDISNNNNEGIIENCEIIDNTSSYSKLKYIPHRRESIFNIIEHKNEGFNEGRWRDDLTRWNQLRYHNEVLADVVKKEGLSTCKYTLHGKIKDNKTITLKVGI